MAGKPKGSPSPSRRRRHRSQSQSHSRSPAKNKTSAVARQNKVDKVSLVFFGGGPSQSIVTKSKGPTTSRAAAGVTVKAKPILKKSRRRISGNFSFGHGLPKLFDKPLPVPAIPLEPEEVLELELDGPIPAVPTESEIKLITECIQPVPSEPNSDDEVLAANSSATEMELKPDVNQAAAAADTDTVQCELSRTKSPSEDNGNEIPSEETSDSKSCLSYLSPIKEDDKINKNLVQNSEAKESLRLADNISALKSKLSIRSSLHHCHQRPFTVPFTFENLIQLFPKRTFDCAAVQNYIKYTLQEMLTQAEAEQQQESYIENKQQLGFQDLIDKIADKIRNRVLSLNFNRYKIIVLVSLCPLQSQCLCIGSRCIWDQINDRFVFGDYKTQHLYGTATVYGIYTL